MESGKQTVCLQTQFRQFFLVRTAISVIAAAFELKDGILITVITAKHEKWSLKTEEVWGRFHVTISFPACCFACLAVVLLQGKSEWK